MDENRLTSLAVTLIIAVLGAWIYHQFFYNGKRRRKPGGHRFDENCINMMWATVRPTADHATWYQVPIFGRLPLEETP